MEEREQEFRSNGINQRLVTAENPDNFGFGDPPYEGGILGGYERAAREQED